MRFAVVLALLGVSACSLAVNGTDATDAGPGQPRGEPLRDASADVASDGSPTGGHDAQAPSVDAAPPIDATPPPDARDAASEPDAAPTELDVPATDGPSCASWFDTGVDVANGAAVTITATGTWSYGPGPVFDVGPDGTSMGGGTTPGLNEGELVGQIGSGAVFGVGASATTTAQGGGGRLVLGINDSFCDDNAGSMHVSVRVGP
jgi:hypothetical protein